MCCVAGRSGPEFISKLKEGIPIDFFKTLSVDSNTLVMPTPMGVPFSVNFSTSGVFKLEGTIKANSLPETSHFSLRRPFMSRKIEIASNLKARYRTLCTYFLEQRPLKVQTCMMCMIFTSVLCIVNLTNCKLTLYKRLDSLEHSEKKIRVAQ